MCFVLAHACSTGFFNAPSHLNAAMFHISHINTPVFWVENGRSNQDRVHHESAKQVGLRAGGAYSSYLTDHNYVGMAGNTCGNGPMQTSKPKSCAIFSPALKYSEKWCFGTSSTTCAYSRYACIRSHALMPRCVCSMHTKPRLRFRSVRVCTTNEVGTTFRPRIRTVVRAWAVFE
jgi:hypothetical protein